MKRFLLYTVTALIAGLFTSGLALAGTAYTGTESKSVSEQTPGTSVPGAVNSVTLQLNEAQIERMQQLLQDQGHQDVNVTGEIDADTKDALTDFQRSNDLAVTGLPDEDTLRALAPSTEEQEFFGLAPSYGEKEGTNMK